MLFLMWCDEYLFAERGVKKVVGKSILPGSWWKKVQKFFMALMGGEDEYGHTRRARCESVGQEIVCL